MIRKERAIQILEQRACCMECVVENCACAECDEAFDMAIQALKQEPSDDAISRKAVINQIFYSTDNNGDVVLGSALRERIARLPSVNPQEPKTGHCKDCKYFEYDSVAKVDGVPLIVAHEICTTWGDGCKTKEDGYCFMFTPRERNDK